MISKYDIYDQVWSNTPHTADTFWFSLTGDSDIIDDESENENETDVKDDGNAPPYNSEAIEVGLLKVLEITWVHGQVKACSRYSLCNYVEENQNAHAFETHLSIEASLVHTSSSSSSATAEVARWCRTSKSSHGARRRRRDLWQILQYDIIKHKRTDRYYENVMTCFIFKICSMIQYNVL